MKNIINKFTFFVALSFVFISCGNLTTSENDDSIPQGKGKITISTDLQNGRSVLPTAITDTTTGLKWELVGTKNGEQKTIKTWTDDNSRTAYELMTDSEIVIDTGIWDFTLTASNTDGKNVLSATISATINAGNNALNFVMQEATENAASGSIEFTLKFPKDVVGNVVAKLFKYENNDTEISNQTLSIDSSSTDNYSSVKYSYPDATGTTSSDLSAGYYILKVELQQKKDDTTTPTEEFVTINTYSCLIRVAPGLLSQGKYTLPDLAQLYTIKYECGRGNIENQLTTTSYNAYTSFELPEPTYQGHYFAGWYIQELKEDNTITETLFGNAGETTTINKDTTLYAKWTKNYDFQLSKQDGGAVAGEYTLVDGSGCVTITDTNTNVSVWNYYLKSNDINFQHNSNYKITVEMKTERSDSVVAIQAANADMFFTVGTEWTTCTMETGFIEKELDSTRNAITFGIGLSQKTYFRNLVIEEIDDDGLPTLVFDITTEGINQYLNTQNKADKIIEVEKTTDTDNKLVYNITINAPLSHQDGDIAVQDVKLHLRDYAKSVGVNNVSFTVKNTGDNPFATSFLADTASNNSMAWNNVRTEVTNSSFNTCSIDFPNYTANDELTVDVITGSGNAYSNHPVQFTISDFKVTNIESNATPFENKIFAIKTGNTWTQSKEVEVSIPVNGNINFDVGMFSSWDNTNNNNNNMPSFGDVTRFLYTGNIPEGLTYSTGTDDSGNPIYTVTNNSNAAKIVKITLDDNYEVVIEDVSSVTTWAELKSRIDNTSISEIVIKNDLTVTETITISRKVKITADKDVTISRGASCGFFLINSGSLELGSNDCTITLDGGNTTDYATTTGLLIWQYSEGQGVILTNCILQNNTLDDPGYEQGAAIKTEQPFTMNNCSIRNCHGSEGGAVYIFGNGSFTMNGGSITGCTATAGGAVYLYNGSFTMSGDAYIDSNNDVYLAYGKTVKVAGSLTSNTVAIITPASYAVSTPVLTADDTSLLAQSVGKFTLTPSADGTAYEIDADGKISLNQSSAISLTQDYLNENVKTNTYDEYYYELEAGEYCVSANLTLEYPIQINASGGEVKLYSNADYIISCAEDFDNSANSAMIALPMSAGTLTLGGGEGTLTIDGSGISSLSYLIISQSTLNLQDNCTITNGNVTFTAIYVSAGTFTMTGGTITNIHASEGYGAGIHVVGSSPIVTVSDGTICNNYNNGTNSGASIYSTNNSITVLGETIPEGTLYTYNIVNGQKEDVPVSLTGTEVASFEDLQNAINGDDEVIIITSDITITNPLVINKKITICTSNLNYQLARATEGTVEGPMFEVTSNGELTLQNIIITGGYDSGYDDAENNPFIYNNGKTVIENSTLKNNYLWYTGAYTNNESKAIHFYGGGAIFSNGDLTINNSSMENFYINSSSYGGTIYIESGTCNIDGLTISSCSTNKNGAALYISENASSSTVNINNSRIVSNTANTNGGGIFAAAGTININNSEINSNYAQSGNSVYFKKNVIYSINSNTSVTVTTAGGYDEDITPSTSSISIN